MHKMHTPVATYKAKNDVKKKFSPEQIKDIIRLNLVAIENPEDEAQDLFVEDIQVEGEADDVPVDVTMNELEDVFD